MSGSQVIAEAARGVRRRQMCHEAPEVSEGAKGAKEAPCIICSAYIYIFCGEGGVEGALYPPPWNSKICPYGPLICITWARY